MPAATSARFPRATSASARSASTTTASCACRGATSAACSATRSRRSRSSTPARRARASASACSAATLHCGYCQNWVTSQVLRDPMAVAPPQDVDAAKLVADALAARRAGRRLDLQRAADHQRMGRRGLQARRGQQASSTGYVSNGNGTPQVLDYIRPWVDCYKVDLKRFDDRHYRELGGALQTFSTRSSGFKRRGIWVEIVTLVVPGFNDSRRRARAAGGVPRGGRPTCRGT